jgi:hypothetical protein
MIMRAAKAYVGYKLVRHLMDRGRQRRLEREASVTTPSTPSSVL